MAEEDFSRYIVNGALRVIAKPGKRKSAVVGFDPEKGALVVEVGAPAEDNKANIELVRFLSSRMGRQVRIKSGFTGKTKMLAFRD